MLKVYAKSTIVYTLYNIIHKFEQLIYHNGSIDFRVL
jgi:hypothetical protein